MALVTGATSTPVSSSQSARAASAGVLTNMLVDIPATKPQVAPAAHRAVSGSGQRHVPIMRTMQQDQSAALTAVKAVDQAQNKHPETKKGGFFSSFLHHDANVTAPIAAQQAPHAAPHSVPIPIVQAPKPLHQPIRMPTAMPPRPPVPTNPQASRVIPVSVAVPPPPVPQPSQSTSVIGQKAATPLRSATQSLSANSVRQVPVPSQVPVKPPLSISPVPVPRPPMRPVASPVLQRQVVPTVSASSQQVTPVQTSPMTPQQRVAPVSVPLQSQSNKIPNISTTPQSASPQSPLQQTSGAISVSRPPTAPQQRGVSPVQHIQVEDRATRGVVPFARQVPSGQASQLAQSMPSVFPQSTAASRVQANQVEATRVGVAPSVAPTPKILPLVPAGQQRTVQAAPMKHVVASAQDTHPAIVSPQVSLAVSVASPQSIDPKARVDAPVTASKVTVQPPAPGVVVAPASTPGIVPARSGVSSLAMQNTPFLPPLSKAPKAEPAPQTAAVSAAVRPMIGAPLQTETSVGAAPRSTSEVKKLVPLSTKAESGVAVAPNTVQVPPLPSVSAPLPPKSSESVVARASETHGTLPGRVMAVAAEERHDTKQPLSQVFPTKQEVVDGAHAALVRNGTLTEGGASGAEERAMNYVDTRLEDENLFGGVNKGTMQVVWGLVKDLETSVVLTGELPTEETSREEHVSHALHEQAYLMVRDVAKKQSLTPKAGETVQAFLVRAAEAGPLF